MTPFFPTRPHFPLDSPARSCYHQPGPVAQWLEQATHNRLVAGSSPAGAIAKGCIPEIEGMQPFSVYVLIFNEGASPNIVEFLNILFIIRF